MKDLINEAVGLIDDQYLSLTEKPAEEILEMSKHQKSIVSVRKFARTMLLAAVLVSLLTVTAFASGIFSLDKRPAASDETYTIHWGDSEWGSGGSITWKDLKYVFKFDGPDACKEVRFKPGWLPFEPNSLMNSWSQDEDGWYSRLVSEGADEVDSMSSNYQPYRVETYYASRFYNDGAMLLMYQTPEEITEEQWGDLKVLRFHAYQDLPANDYTEARHLDYYFVILFSEADGWITVVSGTSDMDTVAHVAKELSFKETGNILKSSDFENNAVFIDVGQG